MRGDCRPTAGMRVAIGAMAIALGATGAPAAEHGARRAKSGEAKQEGRSNPCASYGPGFTMLPGTTTCVRIGGAVEGDLTVGRGSAPNLGVK